MKEQETNDWNAGTGITLGSLKMQLISSERKPEQQILKMRNKFLAMLSFIDWEWKDK